MTNTTWPAHIRQIAALAAFEAEPEEVAGSLRAYLQQFIDAEAAAEVDPDQEILGSLLRSLWPRWIDTGEMLSMLHPKLRNDLIGVYRSFLMYFPTQLDAEGLKAALDWADKRRIAGTDEEPIGQVDAEIIGPLVARYFEISDDPHGLRIVADLLHAQLNRHESPPLPPPLNRVGIDAVEDIEAVHRRHSLALEMLRIPTKFDRHEAWTIVMGWGRLGFGEPAAGDGWTLGTRTNLLAGEDFRWAFEVCSEMAASGDVAGVERLAAIAELIFDRDDPTAFDLIAADQKHPVSRQLSYMFEPVDLDEPIADRLRQQHLSAIALETGNEPAWEGQAAFVEAVKSQYELTSQGDVDAFWQLLNLLHLDPEHGRRGHGFVDDIASLPGWNAVPEYSPSRVLDLSVAYLTTSTDHRDEWLGTNQFDRRAQAGYQALASLFTAGRLEELASSTWRSWTGAIIWFWTVPLGCGDRAIKKELLEVVCREAPDELTVSLVTYIRGELERGQSPSEVDVAAEIEGGAIGDAFAELLEPIADAIQHHETHADTEDREFGSPDSAWTETFPPSQSAIHLPASDEAVSAARRTFAKVLDYLLPESPSARDLVERLVSRVETSDGGVDLAVSAIATTLVADAGSWWPKVHQWISDVEGLSRPLCLQFAASHDWKHFVTDLTEVAVGEVFTWVRSEFPPSFDIETAEVPAMNWRRDVLTHLASRGTPEAVEVLELLERRFSGDLEVAAAAVKVRLNRAEGAWEPPSPQEIRALLANPHRRLVRNDAELASVLRDALDEIQSELAGHSELLWNSTKQAGTSSLTWRPKSEAALCAYITHELQLRLGATGLIINREVMVRPTDHLGAGERTDILVQASHSDGQWNSSSVDSSSVVIEVKGSWNAGLLHSQRTQLVERYMSHVGCRAGVYLIGWYPLDQWDDDMDKNRRQDAARHSRENLIEALRSQAEGLGQEHGVTVISYVLDIERPQPQVSQTQNL